MTTRARTGGWANFSHVQATEAEGAIATLVLAFAADPHLRWLFPDAQQYLDHFPDVLQSFAGVAFAGDTVWKLEGLRAVALWLPPGASPDTDAATAAFETSVPAEKLTDLMAVFANQGRLSGCTSRKRNFLGPLGGRRKTIASIRKSEVSRIETVTE